MRPIKFRAWLKDKKEWYNLDITDSSSVGVLNVNFDYVLCQFTGLKDKNGKEIYEGDIVEYEAHYDSYGRKEHTDIERQPVVFEHGCFVVPKRNFNTPALNIPQHKDRFKVIGNLYENPELL